MGFSIEGIACCRLIEVFEKRGLPSRVRWTGGAAAGAINSAPLFGLNFSTLQSLGRWHARPFLKKCFRDLSNGKTMGILINEETIHKTTKCPSDLKCLNDKTHLHCRPERPIKEYGIFIDTNKSNSCPYKLSFGNGTICNCPVRYEIFKRYNM